MKIHSWTARAAVIAAAAATAVVFAAPANAEVRTGWIGSTPPVDGQLFLHTSTIDNGGVPAASTRIYTAFGGAVAQGTMAAKARLFREGALCSATDYQFNLFFSNSQNVTTKKDCGPGFYNSHGFVGVTSGSGQFTEYITFPSDPLQYGGATTASARTEEGTNTAGQTFGTAETVTSDAELPDLVSAIGTDGTSGFVRSTDLTAEGDGGSRSIPLVDVEGRTVVGTFDIAAG